MRIALKHKFDSIMQLTLALLLAIAFVLSPVSNQESHSLLAVAEIAVLHFEEMDQHGHSHDDAADTISHAFYGHVHNAADHDHNSAFLLPNAGRDLIIPCDMHDLSSSEQACLGLVLNLDRPPRA